MKLGISLNIDVTKLDKSRFYQGKKGKYAKLTVFVDPNRTDEYGNHGGITEEQTKEEREAKSPQNFVGNAKVFWTETTAQANNQPQNKPAQSEPAGDDWNDSIPFAQHEKGFI